MIVSDWVIDIERQVSDCCVIPSEWVIDTERQVSDCRLGQVSEWLILNDKWVIVV
jgi:hypothetical protein